MMHAGLWLVDLKYFCYTIWRNLLQKVENDSTFLCESVAKRVLHKNYACNLQQLILQDKLHKKLFCVTAVLQFILIFFL